MPAAGEKDGWGKERLDCTYVDLSNRGVCGVGLCPEPGSNVLCYGWAHVKV